MLNNYVWNCNDNENTQKEYLFSYYYSFLNATGPLDVATLEASWEEQKELFTDVSLYVTHGIANFLLNSNKFTFIDGKIQIVESKEIMDSIKSPKTNISKDSNLKKNIIQREYPSVDQIITYNIERNKSLIDLQNDIEDENNTVKLSKSISLKINSIILFSNLQDHNEIQICIRPAAEYSTHNMHKSLRLNGLYSFKCNINLSENELNFLSCLLRKHLLLLDYRNCETFEYFISNAKINADNQLERFDDDKILVDNSEVFDLINSTNNISFFQTENTIAELKNKHIINIQRFLFDCEVQKTYLRNGTEEMQRKVLQMALGNNLSNDKFQYRCINYLVFIRNFIEKQIKSFQDKALKVLKDIDEIKPTYSSNIKSNIENNTLRAPEWKLRFYEGVENIKKIRAVYENFQLSVMCENMLDLESFTFTITKESSNYVHTQVKEIIKDNLIKKRIEDNNICLQILQEYIYGPYIGILNKSNPNTVDNSLINNFQQVFPSGFKPKLYFLKSNHNLNVPKISEFEKIKTNIRDSDSISQISNFYFNNFKVPNVAVSVIENFQHEIQFRSAISKLSKYVFGETGCNRFELIVKPNDRKKLSTLNMTELSEKLAEYITECLLENRILISKEKLRYFDFLSLPISIYFSVQTKNHTFESFLSIKCNFRRIDGLPHDIEVEIKKLRPEKFVPVEPSLSSFIDNSLCNDMTGVLKMNTSGYPFLDESSNSQFSKRTDKPSILVATGASPKQAIISINKKSKHTMFNENYITCCICRDHIRRKPQCYLRCNHIFHRECIEKWRQNSKMCPVCRATIIFDEFPPLEIHTSSLFLEK